MLLRWIYARASDDEWRAGYTQSLRPGVKASFGLALDTQRLNEVTPTGPAHKLGAHFVFEG